MGNRAARLGRPRAAAALVAATLLFASPRPAAAFGALLTSQGEATEALRAARVAVQRRDDGAALLTYQLDFLRSWTLPRGLVWVLPVPAGAVVSTGGCEVFAPLGEVGSPQLLIQQRLGSDGCSCEEWSPPAPTLSSIGAHEWASSAAEIDVRPPRRYATLDELVESLADDGFALPIGPTRETLVQYTDPATELVLAFVNDATEGTVCLSAHVPGPRGLPRYRLPLRAASIGARLETEFLVYVLDEGRVEPSSGSAGSPYPGAVLDADAVRLADSESTNYPSLFSAAVRPDAPIGNTRAFVIEFAGPTPDRPGLDRERGPWLTRMRSVLAPLDLGADLPLDLRVGGGEVDYSQTILVASAPRRSLAVGLAALALAGVVAAGRGGRGRRGAR